MAGSTGATSLWSIAPEAAHSWKPSPHVEHFAHISARTFLIWAPVVLPRIPETR
jgi:hypothetical protein